MVEVPVYVLLQTLQCITANLCGSCSSGNPHVIRYDHVLINVLMFFKQPIDGVLINSKSSLFINFLIIHLQDCEMHQSSCFWTLIDKRIFIYDDNFIAHSE